MNMIEELKKCLANPGPSYRSAPFWGWNDALKKENLEFQMRELKEAGMGGLFIHSREGLETAYLSREWMEDVVFCGEKARENDLELWIYDEDKWPSGAAGGMVSRENRQKYTAKGLTLECVECNPGASEKEIPDNEREKIIAVYTARIRENEIDDLRLWANKEDAEKACREAEEGESLIILRQEISAESEWYNGFAPPDNLNPDSVRTFLKLTHEQYEKAFGGQFPEQVKGFFTDEPNFCDFFSIFHKGRPWLPWTEKFVECFQKKRGYDPQKLLPFLFFDGDGAEKIRHDYWKTAAQLFSESYMKQIYDWCEARGLKTTGHILYENDLGYQTRVCGAAMPQLRYLHCPGIDLLGEQTEEYLTVKQCTSVANQYDRTMTISETYGCTGWEFDFQGQKWLGDWQFSMGISRRCQHLAQYSITGCRKRDYPPVFNYQTTWWEDNFRLENYFGRLSACLSVGKVQRDILVIHPISSVWTKCRSDKKEDFDHLEMNMGWLDEHITSLNRMGETYNRFAKMLLANHLDFDFGDEILLETDGKVRDGRLFAGNVGYSVVIVPGLVNLFGSTVKLLGEFVKQGGTLIWQKPYPVLIDGEHGDIEALLGKDAFAHTAENSWEIPGMVRSVSAPVVSVQTPEGAEDGEILMTLRRTEDGYILFLANHDKDKEHAVRVFAENWAYVEEFDPFTGKKSPVTVSRNGKGMYFQKVFAPVMSRVYFIQEKKEPVEGSCTFPYRHPHYTDPVLAVFGPETEFERTMENVCTIDRCTYELDGREESKEMEIWQAQKEIREKLGMQQVYYNGAPQRYSWLNKKHPKDGTPFAMHFRIQVKESIETPCSFILEKPGGLAVEFDGNSCEMEEGWFMDRDMKKFRIPELLEGQHVITIRGLYSQDRELEDVYLAGSFGVDIHGAIIREPKRLHFGDWSFQGYANYPGSIIYRFRVPALKKSGCQILHIGKWEGTLLKVRVNGRDAGVIIQKKCCQLEVSEMFDQEENLLEIEVVGSPRNMFGPFHQAYTGCSRISWADFRTEGMFHTDSRVLRPYGLMEQCYICEYEEETV